MLKVGIVKFRVVRTTYTLAIMQKQPIKGIAIKPLNHKIENINQQTFC